MRIEQRRWTPAHGWTQFSGSEQTSPGIVFVFGARRLLEKSEWFGELRKRYPKARILSASTAGEILGAEVTDETISATAVTFDDARVAFVEQSIASAAESEQAGERLAALLPHPDLVHAMVFSDGTRVNGTLLVKGLLARLPDHVSVTGGLVGDGADFKKTVVGMDKVPVEGNIVLIGFYGTKLKVGYGSLGGWDPFGPERVITKAEGNVLYELDGKPALALYKEYLGDRAKDLPASGLLFPLALSLTEGDRTVEVVRTILGVNEGKQSLTFAGDMPEGVTAKLMKANFERLIDGAAGAADMSAVGLKEMKPELAILVSCIGRKLVLKERTYEELEAVQQALGDQAALAGFYSYGEICPTAPTEKQCQLHNQTMTITTFRET